MLVGYWVGWSVGYGYVRVEVFSIGLRKVDASGCDMLLVYLGYLSVEFTPPMKPVLIFLAIGVYKDLQTFDFY
jgi:hypothetical protein